MQLLAFQCYRWRGRCNENPSVPDMDEGRTGKYYPHQNYGSPVNASKYVEKPRIHCITKLNG